MSLCLVCRGCSLVYAMKQTLILIQVALNMLREEGFASFYSGLAPSLIGIAPYIALNFCVFDL